MRLLIFISSMSGGGAERVTADLANHWASIGWVITIVTISSQRNDFYKLMPAITRIELGLDGDSNNVLIGLTQNIRRITALRRVLRQVQPDVALGMMTGANILLVFASLGLTQTRIVGSERTYPPECPLGGMWEWLRRKSYGRLDVVVAQTNEGATWLKAHTAAKRVEVIPNSVNWPLANLLPHLGVKSVCSNGKHLLLAVGRLSGEKQFGLLVECFCSLASRYPDWNLVILGEGALRSVLEAQVLDVGMTNRIFLPGRAGNVGTWYSCADLYVMSSRFEGFPNTLVEAMAYGVPVVSFDCDTGPRDIIRHEVDGLLVQPGDVAGLTETLGQLMGDDALRRKLAGRAIDVRERFGIERIANNWEVTFKGVK
jgi:glycosyltransferase involved in cell wall biosynthesis